MSGPQCCANPPALNPSCGGGHVEEFGGLSCYVTGPSDSKLAVLLISDIFGYEAPNLRLHKSNSDYKIIDDKGFEEAKPVIQALKEKGVSKIGSAGFCWGAKVVVQLAQSDYIQAAVLLHPSLVSVDDIKGVKAPISILGAEVDQMSPPELVKQFDEILKSKPEVESFTKIFPGTAHGWTVRYDTEDAAAVKSA